MTPFLYFLLLADAATTIIREQHVGLDADAEDEQQSPRGSRRGRHGSGGARGVSTTEWATMSQPIPFASQHEFAEPFSPDWRSHLVATSRNEEGPGGIPDWFFSQIRSYLATNSNHPWVKPVVSTNSDEIAILRAALWKAFVKAFKIVGNGQLVDRKIDNSEIRVDSEPFNPKAPASEEKTHHFQIIVKKHESVSGTEQVRVNHWKKSVVIRQVGTSQVAAATRQIAGETKKLRRVHIFEQPDLGLIL